MEKRLFFIFVIAVICTGLLQCSGGININEVSFRDAMKYSSEQKDSTYLLLCDFASLKKVSSSHIVSRRFTKKKKALFYSDLSLADNRPASYVLALESLPAIVSFGPDGHIGTIEYLIKDKKLGRYLIYQDPRQFSEEQTDLLNLAFNLFGDNFSLRKADIKKLMAAEDDGARSFLLAKYYAKCGMQDSSIYYINCLIKQFDNPHTPLDKARVRSVFENSSDSSVVASFYPQTVFFSQNEAQKEITDSICINNLGNISLVINSVHTSCRCISIIDAPFVIEKGKHAFIKYTIELDGKPIHQHIRISTNARNTKVKIIPVNVMPYENE